jgi:WD40 repeat protein
MTEECEPTPVGAVARLGTRRFRNPGPVNCVALTPDGKTIASASTSERFDASVTRQGTIVTIRLWEAATGKLLRELAFLDSPVHCLTFSTDGCWLAASCCEVLYLWQTANGQMMWRVSCAPAQRLQFLPGTGTLVSYHSRNVELPKGAGAALLYPQVELKCWEVKSGKQSSRSRFFRLLQAPQGEEATDAARNGSIANAATFSGDGDLLAVATSRGVELPERPKAELGQARKATGVDLRILDATTLTVVREVCNFPEPIAHLAFSADRRIVAAASASEIWLVDVATGTKRRAQEVWPSPPGPPAFLSHGKTLTSKYHRFLLMWDTATGKPLPAWRYAADTPFAVTPDGRFLAAGNGVMVRFWDMNIATEVHSVQAHRRPPVHLEFTPGGELISLDGSSPDSTAFGWCIWDTNTWRLKSTIPIPMETGLDRSSLGYSWRAQIVLRHVGGGSVQIQELVTGRPLQTVHVALEYMASYKGTLSANGAVFVVLSRQDGINLHFYETAKGKKLAKLALDRAPEDSWVNCCFSSDGRLFVYQQQDDRLAVADVRSGRILTQLAGRSPDDVNFDGRFLWLVQLSSDGHYLITYPLRFPPPQDSPPTFQLWDVTTGAAVYRLQAPSYEAKDGRLSFFYALSPDNRLLCHFKELCRQSQVIEIREVVSGSLRRQIVVNNLVGDPVFSPDGRFLATGLRDGTIVVWDLQHHLSATGVKNRLSDKELAGYWDILALTETEQTNGAVTALIDAPRQSVPFLKRHLELTAATSDHVQKWITELDHPSYRVRIKAMVNLEQNMSLAAGSLKAALKYAPSLEAYLRIEKLLEGIGKPSPRWIQQHRTLEILERIGNSEARQLLQELANGAPLAPLTREAQSCLRRMPIQ